MYLHGSSFFEEDKAIRNSLNAPKLLNCWVRHNRIFEAANYPNHRKKY